MPARCAHSARRFRSPACHCWRLLANLDARAHVPAWRGVGLYRYPATAYFCCCFLVRLLRTGRHFARVAWPCKHALYCTPAYPAVLVPLRVVPVLVSWTRLIISWTVGGRRFVAAKCYAGDGMAAVDGFLFSRLHPAGVTLHFCLHYLYFPSLRTPGRDGGRQRLSISGTCLYALTTLLLCLACDILHLLSPLVRCLRFGFDGQCCGMRQGPVRAGGRWLLLRLNTSC